MRLALFTDTLGDVNGVSRFLTTLAAYAHRNNLPLLVLTSTRLPIPALPTITNIPPRFAAPMPRYPQLQLALPSRRALAAATDAFQPTHIHVSTPGPVGLLGRAYAIKRRLPLGATYHTDFPAYIHHLFDHESLTAITTTAMRWFYTPARTIFSRSADYATRLGALGFPESRLARLRPGIDLDLFSPPSPGSAGEGARRSGRTNEGALLISPSSKPPSPRPSPAEPGEGGSQQTLQLLYTGRISVEKNLPFLASFWPRTHAALRMSGINATLTITGEGPYEPAMRAALVHHGARFTGVIRGRALADLYRSADLFLFPSTTDTLGQAVMEAQACGAPCLISPSGGPREITIPNQSSLVLPIRAAAWHNAILQLAADSDRRAAMSRAAAVNGACYPFAASAEHFWARHIEPRAEARRRSTTGALCPEGLGHDGSTCHTVPAHPHRAR
ncbi:MAG TPA: glycosyltransferase [Phycisphaerales bacterium]|nr:glycosyltransferase [Phycisphaerales bacterium]